MADTILGPRIRQRRREVGITQVELAQKIGISPSYLNLIEWNKRRIAGTLLRKTAEALGLSIENLASASEGRLLDALTEIARLPSLQSLDIEEPRSSEFIGRFPGWARGVAALARSEQEAISRAETLSDRLSNDPFLSETIHRMLSRIAAVRSAVEILIEYPDIAPDRRDRFDQIIDEEVRALSDVAEALAAYLDKAEDADRVLTPLDEVEALFDANENHFDQIEKDADGLHDLLTEPHPISRRQKADVIAKEHFGDTIGGIVHGHSLVNTSAAHTRARQSLANYAVGAILMPMPVFTRRASELRYDIEALAEAFSVEVDAVCHRLTALPRQAGSPRFGYLRANAAGTIIEMLKLDGLAVPRYAAACPLWVLYRAQQSPEAVIRQRALFPSGARFVFVARARNQGPTGFGKPRHYLTDMIAMREDDAHLTVYSPDPSVPVEEVGPSCRLCPRTTCAHRVEDPFSE